MPLGVSVVKASRAGVRVIFLRRVLVAAAGVPAVARRLGLGSEEAGGEIEMTVRITGDRELRRLNRTYLGIDAPTDVLSFAGSDGYLGDLAVSWPAVVRQAETHGHSTDAEAALLCVHGLLHLAGWDHATPAQERAMWGLTATCLAAAGVEGLARDRLALRS